MASRRELGTNNLSNVINDYARLKEKENEIGKTTKVMGAQIKEAILKTDSLDCDTGEYVASVSVIPNDDFDNEKAIQIAQTLPKSVYKKLVETKLVFNREMLESLIYTGEIKDASLFAECIVEKTPTYRLNIKKSKGGKK